MIGETILNYEIKSIIGEGGMGSVYLAEHTQMPRVVAIKVLLPQFMSKPEIRERFKNEASTMANLQHPNIVGLLDYLEDEKGMYLIMEYVEGEPLDDYIKNVTGPMPEERVIPIITEILNAVGYAHDNNIVHRDIKPANVIISKNGTVKILDFGIARILGDGNKNLTKTGTQMGTIFYMSPEQVQGKPADFRSDIYSLGVTFYQMLTGLNPYGGLTTEYEVYTKIIQETLPPPQDVYPGVPEYFSSILNKALAKDPGHRFQTCEEFLKAILSKEKIKSLEEKPETKEAKYETEPSQPINPDIPNRIGLYIGVVLALLALVLTIVFVMPKDEDGDGTEDGVDECIGQKGTVNGCPDRDFDGVMDKTDACPDEFGEKENNGCAVGN
jgi:serine/threonine protein kinase